jgi:hypothetical protein
MQRPSRFEVLYHPKSIFVSVIFIVSTIFDRNTDIGKALLPFSKIIRKPYIVQNPKSGLPHTFFLFTFVCIYTNKYNILCRFYVILLVIFTLKNTIVCHYILLHQNLIKCQNCPRPPYLINVHNLFLIYS